MECNGMKIDMIKIGNWKGIRLPQAVLKQCGIDTQVDLEVTDNRIILKAM
jgi:antitoxin MazE